MIKREEDILKDVRRCMDMDVESEGLLSEGDEDSLTLNDIIKSKMEEAATQVESSAPSYLLEAGHPIDGEVYFEDQGSGWVLLPDDFMRLVVFEMNDWERPVRDVLLPDSPLYALQKSRYKGLRGTPQKPVCVLVMRPEGKALEFYSCKDKEAEISKAMYLPYPRKDRDGGLDVCERLYPAIVYMTAALVYASCGETEKASLMTELSKSKMI